MINRVILTGRITSDIELRRTNDGTPYTFFTIAVNRRSGNDQTDFISCVAWRQTAELMNNYLNKGSLIGVEGRLEVYSRQEEGRYENRTNVQVSNITFLESRAQSEQRSASENYDNQPSQQNQNQNENDSMTFAKEVSFDQTETTPAPASENVEETQKSEEVNANNINLEEIKF